MMTAAIAVIVSFETEQNTESVTMTTRTATVHVRYVGLTAELARVYRQHAPSQASQAWAEVARQRLQAASERWQRVTIRRTA